MTPTLIFDNGSPLMAVGSPGGSRIITTVLQMIVNVIDFSMDINEALPHLGFIINGIQIE